MPAAKYTLVIGDKNLSSWSLRPWLAMAHLGIPFEEERIRLRQPDSKAAILRHSPSGKVPALKTNGLVVFDSLAILEYLADAHPGLGLWPAAAEARALARAVSADMHSGFATLRNEMPMDLTSRLPTPPIGRELGNDIRRIVAIWRELRDAYGSRGPFLFGAFSAADAMYAPVATRFRTYGVDLAAFGDDGSAAGYVETIFAMLAMAEWESGAREELAARASA